MMSAKGAIRPVYQVMSEAGEKFDPNIYIPAVKGYYTDTKGQMLSFPFNSSTTVFYYNKDAFQKAGLDPNRAPVTWPEVMAAAAKIKAAGAAPCGFTTGWQSWTQLESFSAWHNVLFASKENGFAGKDPRLLFNSPLHVRHISNLQDWAKKGYFTYAGRKNEPRSQVLQRRMRDVDVVVGGLRHDPEEREVRVHRVAAAVLRRREGGAAEHHHRRRQPLDHVRPQQTGIQGRRQVPELPLPAAAAGRMAPGDRLPADHLGSL